MQHRSYWFAALAGTLAAFTCMTSRVHADEFLNNMNTFTVHDCPQPVVRCQPQFVLNAPATIDTIQTYHRQTATGPGKTLGLMDEHGAMVIQSMPVTVQPASPGFENWVLSVSGKPQLVVGTYKIIDSQADTWAQNDRSCDGVGVAGAACNKGFAIVRGSPAPAGPGGASASASITDCTATCNIPPAPNGPPIFACSAHGPKSMCRRVPPTVENPGGNVMCSDGKNVTTCNCRTGCTTQ